MLAQHSERSVLVVDDEDRVRNLIAHWLTSGGYSVHEATTAEEYLIESVVRPNAYVVAGYPDNPNPMPPNFGERITLQNMADLLAYMLTFR